MEEKDLASVSWDFLGNMEGVLSEIEELKNLLIMLEENYFYKYEVSMDKFEDIYFLCTQYKYQQSLIFTINRCLASYSSELRNNIYKMYDEVKAHMKSNATQSHSDDTLQMVA